MGRIGLDNKILLKLSKHKAKKIVEGLINEGKEIFSKYEKYDSAMSSFKIIRCPYDSDLSKISIDGRLIIYYKYDGGVVVGYNENNESEEEITFFEILLYDTRNRKTIHETIDFDQKINCAIESEVCCGILQYLSEKGINVLNHNEYKKWENRCIEKLVAVGYGDTGFIRAKGSLSIKDNQFIESFSRQIDSLKTVFEIISESRSISVNFIKCYRKLVKWMRKTKKFIIWILGTLLSGLLVLWLQDPLKNFFIWLWNKSISLMHM